MEQGFFDSDNTKEVSTFQKSIERKQIFYDRENWNSDQSIRQDKSRSLFIHLQVRLSEISMEPVNWNNRLISQP